MTVKHERPGVYSSYETSGLTASTARGSNVAIVAAADGGDGTWAYQWTSYSRAVDDVGDCQLSQMAQMAIRNGAGMVYGIPVGDEDYQTAFATMSELENVRVVVCDSTDLSVQQLLRTAVENCSAARKERIAVVGGALGETTSQLVARAAGLNHERMVLVAPGCVDSTGKAIGSELCAAAVAGAIAGNTDPALPLGGMQLHGLNGLESHYGDGEIDLLVRGGVTPLEMLAGDCYVIRGITTRTTSGTAPDITWRELTTILVVDEVIPGIRNALRARFNRAKNTGQTRGAIRSQTILELERRMAREIIDDYEDVMVSALEDDPTVCLVEFSFTVAHGLNQIWLSAHITI